MIQNQRAHVTLADTERAMDFDNLAEGERSLLLDAFRAAADRPLLSGVGVPDAPWGSIDLTYAG